MVDIFALALSHGLIALAVWRLLQRPDLDREGEATAPRRTPRGQGMRVPGANPDAESEGAGAARGENDA
ncbi:hypothetical protein [Novosphingobium sp. BW1]|uniref:hypothetical protein n=1 Tax=Novosphingobium sp. BW1 TaxID=2592621 RepID=UPI0011DED013|nr:hypothetical protein [Novosphingobium sp. BW1]TYC90062.1 hypothetical protein FMM79_08535 [Novosphingobium sp. BW1]